MTAWVIIIVLLAIVGTAYYGVRRHRLNRPR
jgi:hypothetical protein